jgi:protein-tyrosine phosphatase
MIDTHCHLLHDLDDGPGSRADSLLLAKALAGAGVTEVVCTPHFSRRFPTAVADAREAWADLRSALGADRPPATSLAAELSPSMALDADPEDLRDRAMGNGYLLVELEPDTPAAVVDLLLERLDGLGLLPVLAHPERCRAVRAQPRVLDSARSAGALVQVVARSLGRASSVGAAVAAWDLLEAGRADLIASDAHRAEHASRTLPHALEAVGERYGAAALEALTVTTPARLVPGGGA